jgi:hypothetical protein
MRTLFECEWDAEVSWKALSYNFIHFFFFAPFAPISNNKDLVGVVLCYFWNPIEVDSLSRAAAFMCVATDGTELQFVHLFLTLNELD